MKRLLQLGAISPLLILGSCANSVPPVSEADLLETRLADIDFPPDQKEDVIATFEKYPLSPVMRVAIGADPLRSTSMTLDLEDPTNISYCYWSVNTGFVALGAPGSIAAAPREALINQLADFVPNAFEFEVLRAEGQKLSFMLSPEAAFRDIFSDEPGSPERSRQINRQVRLANHLHGQCTDFAHELMERP